MYMSRYLLRHCPTPTMNHLRRVVAAPTNLACVRRSLSSAVPKTWGKPAEGPTFNSVSQSWSPGVSQSLGQSIGVRLTDTLGISPYPPTYPTSSR